MGRLGWVINSIVVGEQLDFCYGVLVWSEERRVGVRTACAFDVYLLSFDGACVGFAVAVFVPYGAVFNVDDEKSGTVAFS